MAKGNGEPRIKTGWRDDRNSYQNQAANNLGTRSDRASKREMDGMRALAKPLTFEMPPDDPNAIGSHDVPHLPNNKPAAHR